MSQQPFQFYPERAEPAALATPQQLLLAVTDAVARRFGDLTGLTVIAVPLVAGADGAPPTAPTHPQCSECTDSRQCRDSWQQHVAALKQQPAAHWHQCEFGNRCAVVPIVCKGAALAACKLVCPPEIDEDEFDRYVELLDVLVENFTVRYRHRIEALVCQHSNTADVTDDSADAVMQRAKHPHVRAALGYIDQHFTASTLTVASLARALNINPTYLAHLFAQELGTRMSRYIARRRMAYAKQLLRDSDWPIKKVAFRCGYANADWFSHVFRDHAGQTPSEYRQNRQDVGRTE